MYQLLMRSTQTDSTRSRNLELQVQKRVNAELERIRDEEAQRLTQLTDDLTSDPAPSSPSENSSSDSPSLTEKITSALTPSSQQSSADNRSHDSVSKDIAELKSKLQKRKQVEKMEPSLEKAKDGLVACLRTNDRRPLDCWQEVETFKKEVAKLEQRFVDRAMR